MENLGEQDSSLFDLSIDNYSQQSLEQASRWAKFLAIVFICCTVLGLIVFMLASDTIYRLLSFSTVFSSFSSFLVVAAIVVLAVVIILIILLLNFSNSTANGIRENNQLELEKGVASLKNYFMLSGIIGAIVLVLKLIGYLS
jgi:membrane associated rhomboid family serine protease